jgi:membrane fusion protein (multidrug efflux system)
MIANQLSRFGLGYLFAVFLTFGGACPAIGRQAAPVVVAKAAMNTFVDRVEALGTLRANETLDLTATVSETVTAIHFQDGQRVKAGDILVEMTNKEEHALIEEERATIAEAKKQFDRLKPLVLRGAASQALLDQRRREYETALARYSAIESKLQDRLIIAPFSGVVGLRNISVGALIEPGDLITTLDDDTVMKLDFSVSSIHLATLTIGLPIEASSPAFAGRLFTGQVAGISSRIDPVTRSIVVRALLPNPDRLLKPGMLMSVVLLKNFRQALVIPEEALIASGRDNFVLVVNPSANPTVASQRKVTIGGRRPGDIEVLSGINPGELVITRGALGARPGQAVNIIARDAGDETLAQLLNQKQKGLRP